MLLIGVNGQSDGDLSNNAVFTIADLDVDFETVTLSILSDDFPGETSWEMVDVGSGQMVSGGDFPLDSEEVYTEDICVSANACLILTVYDSYGDGMCCAYGEGEFQVMNEAGETIVFNDGDFNYEASESFCVGDGACQIATEVSVSHASSSSANDGALVLSPFSNEDVFTFSIDGGQSLVSSNTFVNLGPGPYNVVVQSETGQCTFEETVTISVCDLEGVQVTVTHPTSVVTTDGAIVITASSGAGAHEYSIDGGQNFVGSGTFLDLPVGDYNVIVMEELGICEYAFDTPLVVGGVVLQSIYVKNMT